MSNFSADLDEMIGNLGMGRIMFEQKHVRAHLGSDRLIRVEDLPDPRAPGSRAELTKRLPELEAARREGRLLEGPLTGNMLRGYTEQLMRDGAPSFSEEDIEKMTSREREIRRAEIQASINAKTFRPKHGGGKTLAELEAAEVTQAEALRAIGVEVRELFESEYLALSLTDRNHVRAEMARGRIVLRPGSRPKK